MNIFVFDIETVPDTHTARRLHGSHDLSDDAVAEAMLSLSKETSGAPFVKLHLQRIVAISAVFRHGDSLRVWSLGDETSSEAELIQRFFAGLEKYTPTLVSWNGSGFDLPVLHFRALYHGISAGTYWDLGENDRDFKFNNYVNRYHMRHIDLMDVLAGYQPKAYAKLDEIAVMLGFPGKMGMSGSMVKDLFFQGNIKPIREYCEMDVLNKYLIYLRFELMRGNLTSEKYSQEIALTQAMLQQSPNEHLQKFLHAWSE